MFSFIIGCVVGGAFVYWIVTDTDKNVKQQAKSGPEVIQADEPSYFKYQHRKPGYYGYAGGFDNLTVCTSCYRTCLYEDQHPVNPCHVCGGKVMNSVSGGTSKKISGRWLKRRKKWLLAKDSHYPYPEELMKDVEEPREKDITPQQKKLQDNS